MSARWLIAATALLATPAAAQEVTWAEDLADRFERALVAGDYRVLPITEDFTYTENGAELDPWDGLWRTTTAVEGAVDFPELDFRVEHARDLTAVRVVEYLENGVHGVMAYRLVAREGAIASVEVLPIREEFGGDRGGTITLLQPMLEFTMDGELVEAASPAYLAFGGALDDATLRARVADYFAAYSGEVPAGLTFAEDCVRVDNGQQATGVADAPVLDPEQPGFHPYALGCEEQLRSRFYSNFAAAEPTVYTDPARGLAIAFVRLDQAGTKLSFEAPGVGAVAYPGPRGAVEGADTGEQFDGRVLTNMITPMSVNGVYLFKFDEAGEISRIDAFYRGAPLGRDAVPD